MTICNDCAENKGLIPKDKCVGIWKGECPYCRHEDWLTDEIHDWKYPGQKSVTLHDIFLYQESLPEERRTENSTGARGNHEKV